MAENNVETTEGDDDDGPSYAGIAVAGVAIAATALFWALGWTLPMLIGEVVVISIVIWQACDPFADAAQWIGNALHLPGSVRGATLDAVASSLPELFTGIFFVIIATSALQEGVSAAEASGEGYGATVATCAGSAVYNMILIPAFVALVISFRRASKPAIEVENKVIARDGMMFLLCEFVLIICLYSNVIYWWMGLILIGLYIAYIIWLVLDWKQFQRVKKVFMEMGVKTDAAEVQTALSQQGKQIGLAAVQQVQDELERGDDDDDDDGDGAGVFFGMGEIPLNHLTAWLIIIVSTAIAAGACYFLVGATHESAEYLGVPTFFIAVIVAAAASSVPDTFISIGAALRGDDSGAVSNAFGSNIFDICICLAVPLLLNSYLTGWEPVSLMQDGKPLVGLVGLRILLGVLTVITLLIMWHNRQLTRNKAYVLCALYCVFIAYAVLGSMGLIAV